MFLNKAKNCNIIVYGPTNSGKTHTMLGKTESETNVRLKSPSRNFRNDKENL